MVEIPCGDIGITKAKTPFQIAKTTKPIKIILDQLSTEIIVNIWL